MSTNHAAAALAARFAADHARLAGAFAELPATAQDWLAALLPRCARQFATDGHVVRWAAALAALPELEAEDAVAGDVVRITGTCTGPARDALVAALLELAPWRKGPFELFGVDLDAEWRSELKWARIAPHLQPLAGRHVLDVGCGNGYYAWRMAAGGAALVLGLDPSVRALAQFAALRRYWPVPPVYLLPFGSEVLDARLDCFDTVFSMGVLYHRRAPQAHLRELRAALRRGGQLVLETLVIAAGGAPLLVPGERYCAMRNVWAIPAPRTVLDWLAEAGFGAARLVDLTVTTGTEQRRTAWMTRHSLAEFLDPQDATRTREGHPAPLRAAFVATAE